MFDVCESLRYTERIHFKLRSLEIFPVFSSLIVIKRGAIVEADKSFTSQLRVMNMSEGSPYETLHSYISNAVAPYFKSYVRVSGRADR